MGWYVIKGIKRQPLAPHILHLSSQGGWDSLGWPRITTTLISGWLLASFRGDFSHSNWFFFLMFLPLLSPIHSNFFNLWNTAWLASCEDLPTPTLTHKYLLSSQHFGRRPSVFIVRGSLCRVELALLFIVLLERFSMCALRSKGFFGFSAWFAVRCERKSALRSTILFGSFTEDVFDSPWLWVRSSPGVSSAAVRVALLLVNDGRASQLPLPSCWCHRTKDNTNLCVRKGQTEPSQKVKVLELSL